MNLVSMYDFVQDCITFSEIKFPPNPFSFERKVYVEEHWRKEVAFVCNGYQQYIKYPLMPFQSIDKFPSIQRSRDE